MDFLWDLDGCTVDKRDVEIKMSAVEGIVDHAGLVHFFDNFEDRVEDGEPLGAWRPAMLCIPAGKLVDIRHVDKGFGDNNTLVVAILFAAGEVDDFHRRDAGFLKALVISPFELKGGNLPQLENEVRRVVVLLPFQVDGLTVVQVDAADVAPRRVVVLASEVPDFDLFSFCIPPCVEIRVSRLFQRSCPFGIGK